MILATTRRTKQRSRRLFFATLSSMLSMDSIPLFLRRGVRRGAATIVREDGFGTALGALTGTLLLGQFLLLLVIGVQGGLSMLREQTDLRLQILDKATDSQIQHLYQTIRELPYVEDVLYITREQAYERQKQRDPNLVNFLVKFGIENPFPETMAIRLKRLGDYPEFSRLLLQPPFTGVVDPAFLSESTDQERQMYRIIAAVSSAEYALLFFIFLLLAVLLFTVIELIRRRVLLKREELFVQQLSGADRRTIFTPFCTEMVLLLGSSFLLSLLVMGVLIILFPLLVPAFAVSGIFGGWASATTAVLVTSLPWLLPLEALVIAALALVGTFLALHSLLKKDLLPLVPLR